jgi:hypothetical protein
VSASNRNEQRSTHAAPTPSRSHREAQQDTSKKSSSDYMRVVELMKEMNSRDSRGHAAGFDPIPPSQHEWQASKGEPPKYRGWSWMLGHTVKRGHRTAFATNREGRELHIEHMAADLQMDLANAYKVWKQLCADGICRPGTEQEGERRMYLCGNVKPKEENEEKGEGEAKDEDYANPEQIVCTYNLPSRMSKEIKDWPRERRVELRDSLEITRTMDRSLNAALMAARRTIVIQEEDTILARFGLKRNRQEHQKADEKPEELAERRARISPLLEPLQLYAHTIKNSAHTLKSTPHEVQNGSVHTTATLLPSESQSRGQSVRASEKSQQQASPKLHHSTEGEKFGYLPAAEQAIAACFQNPEAAQLFFFELPRMQHAFKHTDFGLNEFSEERKTDQILVGRLILITGAGQETNRGMKFLLEVAGKFKGLDRNALGKLTPRAPGHDSGPRGFGLLLEWAKDFASREGQC